ncbi:DUF4180 domain-containing protein [Planosporangium flavigriseum]|uniref:DUF4180 domain-containing protein n=1 Tax=Planosporangium flavigriseum TaxID=373681 RepID=A0A8J3PMJ4_9ACTN|nr:DUF4180 domain-containing protein [Planosporangium flavigriseum]NJC67008.1 DUF4180 domain-containing protein [Planosporangium flavigriseum]GIG73923.1 hypothetical protein Pfl04_23270 [Planosporangium flavigriseum]
MPDIVMELHGMPVLVCAAEGPKLADEAAALDLIGEAMYAGAQWVSVPVERVAEDFFLLRTGLAGEIAQKFVNYRLCLTIVGDISHHVASSTALRDFVFETNRGRQLWFVTTPDEFAERLRPRTSGPTSQPRPEAGASADSGA